MEYGAKRISALGLLLAGLLLATGCPESNVLLPGTGSVAVRVEVVNVDPAGRFLDDLSGATHPFGLADQASIQVRDIIIEPLDPQADNAAGSIPFNLLIQSVNPGYVEQRMVERVLNLNTGSYRVVSVRFAGIFLDDLSDGMGGSRVDPADWADPMNPICGDFVRSYSFALNTDSLVLSDFGKEVTFNVTAQGGSLTVRVDGQALIDTLTQHLRCGTCTCEENYNPMDPSTLECVCGPWPLDSMPSQYFVDGPAFRAAGPSILSFE